MIQFGSWPFVAGICTLALTPVVIVLHSFISQPISVVTGPVQLLLFVFIAATVYIVYFVSYAVYIIGFAGIGARVQDQLVIGCAYGLAAATLLGIGLEFLVFLGPLGTFIIAIVGGPLVIVGGILTCALGAAFVRLGGVDRTYFAVGISAFAAGLGIFPQVFQPTAVNYLDILFILVGLYAFYKEAGR